ncbi:hypothetical protein [Pseudomonas syringae]|uniref:hypothetical protein n=1 Tax=Pseudomonas syringae TaxID=317 RepID=UPI000A5A47D0|nr:hypothetical protein [Pseudomonas syringae]
MQKSEQVHIELQKAERAVESMRNSATIEEFEESWKSFLHRIERTWNRILNHYQKSPKWNGWQANILKLRKNDPLLSYLINARGADEHTGDDIVTRFQGGISITSSDGGPIRIKSFESNGQGMRFEGSSNSVFSFFSSSVEPKDITNRGRIYHVPHSHLGEPIVDATAVHLAEMGLFFYSEFIANVEKTFVG